MSAAVLYAVLTAAYAVAVVVGVAAHAAVQVHRRYDRRRAALVARTCPITPAPESRRDYGLTR